MCQQASAEAALARAARGQSRKEGQNGHHRGRRCQWLQRQPCGREGAGKLLLPLMRRCVPPVSRPQSAWMLVLVASTVAAHTTQCNAQGMRTASLPTSQQGFRHEALSSFQPEQASWKTFCPQSMDIPSNGRVLHCRLCWMSWKRMRGARRPRLVQGRRRRSGNRTSKRRVCLVLLQAWSPMLPWMIDLLDCALVCLLDPHIRETRLEA